MTENQGTRFFSDRSQFKEAQARGEPAAYTAALGLPLDIKPMCAELREMATAADQVSVLNPLGAYLRLRSIRKKYRVREPAFRAQLQDCFRRLAEPVEGSTTAENAWLQGMTLAGGLSALLELNAITSAVSEALDRKSAYALACFSLYISILSLVLSLPLRWEILFR
jgi:hypothetical protein